MKTTDWTGRKVLIIGAARQGTALARYLVQQGASVVINDRRSAAELAAVQTELADLPVKWALGGHPLELLDDLDLICPSGGIPLNLPLVAEALRLGIAVSNDSQIFLDAAPCKVVGITGSAGKTTTTTLVGRMARAAFGEDRVWVGGNIGNPLISELDQIGPTDLAVIELSSFQLDVMTSSPQIAAVLNITPNHLDRHGSMPAYTSAKARILDYQSQDGIAVLGSEDPGAWALAGTVQGQLVSFGRQRAATDAGTFLDGDWLSLWEGEHLQQVLSREAIALRGTHNLLNVLAACAIGYAAGIPAAAMQAGVAGFGGVPHRLELISQWGQVDWYNDSIATAPERAIAAIRAFDEPLVLLAGGRDKDLPWEELAALIRQRVDHLVLFGEAAELIAGVVGQVRPGSRPYSIEICSGLETAVEAAARVVEAGDIVLLSPGGTSFDEFRDFAERGEWYRKWVNKLP